MADYLLDTRGWVDPGNTFPPKHWPTRIRNSLAGVNIKTWGQLIKWSDAEIARIPGMGSLSQRQLKQLISEAGWDKE